MSRAEVLRETVCVQSKDGTGGHLLLFANRLWLPLETAYPQEIAEERNSGLRLGQVCMLESNGSPGVILRLFRKTWDRIRFYELDAVYAAIDPDDTAPYQRIQFEDTGWDHRLWDFADYAMVKVLRLDVRKAPIRASVSLLRRFTEK